MANQSSGSGIPEHMMIDWSNTPLNLFSRRMAIVVPSVYSFGFVSNILVLWIFFTDGFATTSNINFFSLAAADLCVCSLFIVHELFTNTFHYFWKSTIFLEIWYIWRVYFFPNREALKSFSAWVTAVITLERLLCVTFPLKVKRIITQKRTTGVILGYWIYVVLTTLALNVISWWLHTVTSDLSNYVHNYNKEWNISIYTMLPNVTKTYIIFQNIDFYGRLVMVKMTNQIIYGTIAIATILLIMAFKRSVRERKSLTGKTKTSESAREKRLVQSVIAVCVIFILTSSPINIMRMEEVISDKWILNFFLFPYVNLVSDLLEAFNHSINIFVYLSINSKFRGRFKGLFGLTSVRSVSTKKETKRIS